MWSRIGSVGFDTAFAFFQDSDEVGGQNSKRIVSSAMSESYGISWTPLRLEMKDAMA